MKQINIRLPEGLLAEIDAHREETYLGSQQAAIIELIRLGLVCREYQKIIEGKKN